VKVLALDYGSARTGVAVSDPTGTVARPLGVVEAAGTEQGIARLVELAHEEGVERVVVGLPVTLRGERGAQAEETDRFVELLRQALDLPIESFDERFTTKLARQTTSGRENTSGREKRPPVPEDAVAAAHLLASYLTWKSARPA
jgi:putative Holliday junction resolvase